MDTVTVLNDRRPQSVPDGPNAVEAGRTLAVTATYVLTEEGRKALLLAGGDGRAVQDMVVEVPSHRLHLVSVDANGVARLKLRPRYRVGDDQRVARIDAPPEYDAPPSIEDMFREAARNHQLESMYQTERRTARSKRRDADRETQVEVAQAFLGDPNQTCICAPRRPRRSAVPWQPSTAACCSMPTPTHRREGRTARSASEVPRDLRARQERNQQGRAAQLALHEEKKRFHR